MVPTINHEKPLEDLLQAAVASGTGRKNKNKAPGF
jgi:hypothetical protein